MPITPDSIGFDEREYLTLNPTVEKAVNDGRFPDGWTHFVRHGYKEYRRGAPAISVQQIELLDTLNLERYWEERRETVYLQHVYALSCFIGRNAESIIDVGSNGCPYLEWFPWIENKLSIDLHHPYKAKDIKSIVGDFLKYYPDRVFDLALCLQVLEHVPDVENFARRLLLVARHLIISVPYKWPVGPNTANMGHIHDPVDESKIALWFGRTPDFQMISTERDGRVRRLICYYMST